MVEITKSIPPAQLAQVFRALSNENRLQIFSLVRRGVGRCCALEGETYSCVCDIGEQMDLALSTVSHHLKELRNAGLIRCEKRGQWVYCAVNPEALGWVEAFLAG